MVSSRPERSRLGDLLLEMRLVDEESMAAAIAEQRASGRRLPRILAERRILDEERLAKAVAAKLGLEAVTLGSLKIHERVLALLPAHTAVRHGVLPIAIKRTQQAEVLYLVMIDPLDADAISEVQRLTGRQVRVLMATASEVDQALEGYYRLGKQGAGPVPTLVGRPLSAPPAKSGATPSPVPVRATPTPAPLRAADDASRRPEPSEPAARRPLEPPRSPSQVAPRPLLQAPPRRSASAVGPGPEPVRSDSNPEGRRPDPALLRGRLEHQGEPGVRAAAVKALESAPSAPRGPAPTPSRGTPSPVVPSRPAFDTANRATLIDTARPPELDHLLSALQNAPRHRLPPGALGPGSFGAPDGGPPWSGPATSGAAAKPVSSASLAAQPPAARQEAPAARQEADENMVFPSELDPPEAMAPTRIDPGPFARLEASDRAPQPAAPPSGLVDHDWDLAVRDWEAQEVARQTWTASTELQEAAPEDAREGPEDIATSQLDLGSGEGPALAAALQLHAPSPSRGRVVPTPPASAPPTPRSPLAFEIPVQFDEGSHPFVGPAPQDVPAGLEKTGIFPGLIWDDEGFVPPPLAAAPRLEDRRLLAGGADIPLSPEAVKARFEEASPGPEDDDDIEAIEELAIEPLDDADFVEVDEHFDEPIPLVDEDRPLPHTAAASPSRPPALRASEDSDADRVPVIEPSSLASLMDDDARLAPGDTGADVTPFLALEALSTRVFDETNRPPASPRVPRGQEDEPTNPRIASGAVQAALEATPPEPPQSMRAPLPRPPAKSEAQATPRAGEVPARPAAEQAAEAPPQSPKPAQARSGSDASEEPTPSRDSVDRAAVLSALAGAFVETGELAPAGPPAPAPKPAAPLAAPAPAAPAALPPAPPRPRDASDRLVTSLLAGDSLTSAERAQLVLALGRVLIEKGILKAEDLAAALRAG